MDGKFSPRAIAGQNGRKYSLPCVLTSDGASVLNKRRSSTTKRAAESQHNASKQTTRSISWKPIVSTKSNSKYSSWSRRATESSAKYGNIFRNFYNVGYQRQRRLVNGRKIWWQNRQWQQHRRDDTGFAIAVFHLIMKLRERVVICFGVTFVLFTLLLVIDFQYEIGYGRHRLVLPMRHGRVQVLENAADGERSVYRTFQNRFGGAEGPVYEENSFTDTVSVNDSLFSDTFGDLTPYTLAFEDLQPDDAGRKVVIVVYEYRNAQPLLSEFISLDHGPNQTLQTEFQKKISKREMYKDDDPVVPAILNQMKQTKIVHVREKEGGTQLKLIIHYENGDFALFKPMRFPREQQTLPNHFYFTDYERHNAEIAAFHLDRILGFRRAMPVTGRVLNLTTEFYRIADGELLKTFFISPANNLCFHGHCSYYCDTSHAICGSPDMLEGSFAAFLPEKHVADRTLRKHPWRRSYHKRRKALWEQEPNYCDAVKETPPYNNGILLLDLIDTSIFDFLMGNMDRHHFETFTAFGNDTFPLHLDHGRGFGKPFHDELSILAPLTQCCIIKQSTLIMLLGLHNGQKKLSDLMRESLATDPINPILWEPHFPALDRRIKIILEAIRSCIKQAKETSSIALSKSDDTRSADASPSPTSN